MLHDGREVALKIQYPGVADGIDSDIDNLMSILNIGGLFPKGMYLEEFVKVARAELKLECDYKREARAMTKFRELLRDNKEFYVPQVNCFLWSLKELMRLCNDSSDQSCNSIL